MHDASAIVVSAVGRCRAGGATRLDLAADVRLGPRGTVVRDGFEMVNGLEETLTS
jgi:hypothetical protein